MKKNLIFISLTVLLLTSCSDVQDSGFSGLFPDYSDVTIPCNIAPLNFRVGAADRIIVQVKGGSAEYEFKGRNGLVRFPVRRWHSMLDAEKGGKVTVTVRAKGVGGAPDYNTSFSWTILTDSIDKYLSYRLIEPAYEVWNRIQIEQRDIESFRTVLLGDNRSAGHSCMNCHTSNRNGTSFMHLRGPGGGTILNRNGKLLKLNTRTDHTGGGVYGDITADGRYGVFTTADITFAVHTRRDLRMEVYDKRSDLVVIDFDNLTVTESPATSGDEYQETFPCFSADGRTIFFCRAVHHEQPDSISDMRMLGLPSNDGRGPLLYDSASVGISATTNEKKACVEFVKILLSEDIQQSFGLYTDCIPVRKTAYESTAEQAVEKYNSVYRQYKDMYPRESLIEMGYPFCEIDKKTIADFETMLNTCSVMAGEDTAISIIVCEEIPAYFAGQKSAAEVSDIIQSRISVYLKENE